MAKKCAMPARTPMALFTVVLAASLGACARFHSHASGPPLPGTPPSANLSHGKMVFAARCAVCHGVGGSGGPIGPPLRGEHNRRALAAVIAIVKDPFPPMPKLYPAQMSLQDVRDVSAFVDSL